MDFETSPAERADMLDKMQRTSNAFYAMAVTIGHHQFIEMAGFMNEYIKACREMHARGEDFNGQPLKMAPYEIAYIAEKFDCIFGEAMRAPGNAAVFQKVLGV